MWTFQLFRESKNCQHILHILHSCKCLLRFFHSTDSTFFSEFPLFRELLPVAVLLLLFKYGLAVADKGGGLAAADEFSLEEAVDERELTDDVAEEAGDEVPPLISDELLLLAGV